MKFHAPANIHPIPWMQKSISTLFLSLAGTVLLNAQIVTIDATSEYQTIEGFGGMIHTSWVEDLNEDQREKVFGNQPWNMGLSILRVHIDPNSYRFQEAVPTALYASKQGAKVIASPWDPPAALIDRSTGEPKLPSENYGAYAAHLNSFITVMENAGVPLYAVSVQNEPDIGEWTSWTAPEIMSFVKEYGHMINSRLIAAESFNFNRSYTDPILKDATAIENVDIIGGHIYGNGLYDYPLARQKGKSVWMTEHLTGSDSPSLNTWALALAMGKEIHDCMNANFNAYLWWYIRRFYSLMRDDGNISEKGYVMTHFSKFVRPGAVRVSADVSSAPGVYTNAFKTDSSMTIVAINTTGGSKDLTITIENAAFDEYVKFTSSKSRALENTGKIDASDGSFTITLDAFSISTITTNADAGGKFNNQLPQARAGEDLVLEDLDADRQESVTLDALASSDPDGQIVNYSWAMDGQQIATTPATELSLPLGEHDISLTVTDNDGARSIDRIHVSIKSAYSTERWIEPECTDPGTNWERSRSPDASNEYYLHTVQGVEQLDAPSEDEMDLIRINFQVVEESLYTVWGRVITPNAGDDSFWVKMDDSDWINWNGIPSGSSWHWDDVHSLSNDNPAFFDLSEGEHTLFISYREDGALLDKILISNAGKIPEGKGENIAGCKFIETTTELWYEAECPTVGDNWASYANDSASNNIYLSAPEGIRNTDVSSINSDDVIRLAFDISEEGEYKVWGRLQTPSEEANSLWVNVDNSEWVNWGNIPVNKKWHWDDAHMENDDAAVTFNLTEGRHFLFVCINEPGIRLDKLLITNTGIRPEGSGGEASSCEVDVLGSITREGKVKMRAFPNPSSGMLKVEWEEHFSRLEIVSMDGRSVLSKTFSTPVSFATLNLELEAGLYMLRVRNQENEQISSLMIIPSH